MKGYEFSKAIFPFPIGTEVRVTVRYFGKKYSVDCIFDGWGVKSERVKASADVYPVFKDIANPARLAVFEGFNSTPETYTRYTLPKFDDIVSIEPLQKD